MRELRARQKAERIALKAEIAALKKAARENRVVEAKELTNGTRR
jgi:hypothetical protein